MACKIRNLKAALRKAGFISRQGKGSHTVWRHLDYTKNVVLAGKDKDDAPRYLQREVNVALSAVREINDTSSQVA